MSIESLIDYRNGDIPKGLGIGTKDLDKYLVYKPNRFVCIVGRPNIGKTFILLWYLLCLSKRYGLRWAVYSIENEEWVLRMYLVEFIGGKPVDQMTEKEIHGHNNWINHHFKFIEQKSYTIEQILNEGSKLNRDGLLIDPYNALNKPSGNSHDYDYNCIRLIQDYKKSNGSVYLNHHPITISQRRLVSDRESEYFGYPDYMRYYDVEGGGKWFNACDSWISLHRFTSHTHNWNLTSIMVEKEKVVQTGGGVTPEGVYALAEYIYNRFKVCGVDPLSGIKDLDFENGEQFSL